MLQQLYSNTKPAGTHHSRPSPQHDGELVSLFCSCFSFWEGRGGCLREYEQAKSRFIKCECGGWVNVAALLCVSIRLSGCKCSTLFSPALHSAVLGYVLLLYYGDVWPKRCAALRHTTPHTLLTHCFKHPLRLFHSTCQTVIHLCLSPLSRSLPPSQLLIFSPTPTSLCLTVSITLLGLYEHSYGFVFLKKNTILQITYCEWCTYCALLHHILAARTPDEALLLGAEWVT